MAFSKVEEALQLILQTPYEDLSKYPTLIRQAGLRLLHSEGPTSCHSEPIPPPPYQPEPVLSPPSQYRQPEPLLPPDSQPESVLSLPCQSMRWQNLQAEDFTIGRKPSSKSQSAKSQRTKSAGPQPGLSPSEALIASLNENITTITALTKDDSLLTEHAGGKFLDDIDRLFHATPKDRAAGFAGLIVLNADYQRFKSAPENASSSAAFADSLHRDWQAIRHYLSYMKKLEVLKADNDHWGICIALTTLPVNTWNLSEYHLLDASKFMSEYAELLRTCGSTFRRFFKRYLSKLVLRDIKVADRVLAACHGSEDSCPNPVLQRLCIDTPTLTALNDLKEFRTRYQGFTPTAADLLKLLFFMGGRDIPKLVLQAACSEELFHEELLDSSIATLNELGYLQEGNCARGCPAPCLLSVGEGPMMFFEIYIEEERDIWVKRAVFVFWRVFTQMTSPDK